MQKRALRTAGGRLGDPSTDRIERSEIAGDLGQVGRERTGIEHCATIDGAKGATRVASDYSGDIIEGTQAHREVAIADHHRDLGGAALAARSEVGGELGQLGTAAKPGDETDPVGRVLDCNRVMGLAAPKEDPLGAEHFDDQPTAERVHCPGHCAVRFVELLLFTALWKGRRLVLHDRISH